MTFCVLTDVPIALRQNFFFKTNENMGIGPFLVTCVNWDCFFGEQLDLGLTFSRSGGYRHTAKGPFGFV